MLCGHGNTAMNISHNNNLQYVIACLATHSKWVKDFTDNFSRIHDCFNLAPNDEVVLFKFLAEQGKRILASSLIMEEKRWRELILAMKYSEKIHGAALKQWWLEYVGSSSVVEPIPKTPLHESIQFIQFLLRSKKLTGMGIAIAKYELNRNKAQLHEYNDVDLKHEANSLERISQAINNYKIKLNQSLIIEGFDCHASKLIYSLRINDVRHSENIYSKTEKEIIGFYKNIKTGMVCVINLSELVYSAILQIKKDESLQNLMNEVSIKYNVKNDTILSMLNTLNKNNIITIYERKVDYVCQT